MDKKIQEIREAHAREDNMLLKYPTSSTRKAHEYIGYLLQQIEIKDKALEFYADKKNYEQEKVSFDAEGIDVYWEAPEIQNDGGERARAALKGEDTDE
ncbi:hypothetical protein MKY98_02960 [Paenibacillus sp. FSL M8-0228]|uniref:hypothetical protein n=1 Tax=Paenibacillus sp. FSL M8-0228 TaxID=2921620 RepID=UPI0030F7188E